MAYGPQGEKKEKKGKAPTHFNSQDQSMFTLNVTLI